MRTIARDTASQIALRNCSKEEVGKSQYVILVRRYRQSRIHLSKRLLLGMRIRYLS